MCGRSLDFAGISRPAQVYELPMNPVPHKNPFSPVSSAVTFCLQSKYNKRSTEVLAGDGPSPGSGDWCGHIGNPGQQPLAPRNGLEEAAPWGFG